MHSTFKLGVRSLSLSSLVLVFGAACSAGDLGTGSEEPSDVPGEATAPLDEGEDGATVESMAGDATTLDAAQGCDAVELVGGQRRASTCAGEAYVRRDRKGKVLKAWLECSGECPDDTQKCEERSYENHHGEVRNWCGCLEKEAPTSCHVTIHESAAQEKRVVCAGSCEAGKTCTPQETPVANEGGGVKLVSIKCECK